jgi:Ni/Fe-hydrogenase subunit HybB-like protein
MIGREEKGHARKFHVLIFAAFVMIGLAAFLVQASGRHPERAWQAYLINFLLWSAVAQGGLLFSVVLHITKARWGRPLQGLAESFAAFFPVSFLLFLFLFLGKAYVFPWFRGDLHGKGWWLSIPFLFSRDGAGLLILYGLGFAYLSSALGWKRNQAEAAERRREVYRRRMSVFGVLYIMAYAAVLSILAFDLVMSADPQWISTLFGPYAFVKAFYTGLGGLIIVAAAIHLSLGKASPFNPSHFHDAGKLFFAFSLFWADLFYCQFLVIWYGNLPEETSYIIQRTFLMPWKGLAWSVFIVGFIIPFLILLNRKVKTIPLFMIFLCSLVLIGMWFEHLLLLGPALHPQARSLPVGVTDGMISLGFLGLMAMSVRFLLTSFPELLPIGQGEVK